MSSSDIQPPACWVVIPAAGTGVRMGTTQPKQYLALAGKSLLEHSLDRLLSVSAITGGVLALAAEDRYWAELNYRSDKPLFVTTGGAERCHTVLNALEALSDKAQLTDWVLVHDAARPCVREADIENLISQCQSHDRGGLLAVPVRDTIKRKTGVAGVPLPCSGETVDRNSLWQAQTPQMFRLDELRQALVAALAAGRTITDEASAMEWAGHLPLLVEGHTDNLKITRPEDLQQAAFFLGSRGN